MKEARKGRKEGKERSEVKVGRYTNFPFVLLSPSQIPVVVPAGR
jgi:hypothetical protein